MNIRKSGFFCYKYLPSLFTSFARKKKDKEIETEMIKTCMKKEKTSAPHVVPTLVCQKPSFYLKFSVKKGITPKL